MSFHGFFNNKVSLGNLSSSSALHSVILSHPLLQPPPFQWWWERCLWSMLQTMLQTGLRSITNGMQGWGLAKKNAALGWTGASKPSFPRKENVLWTASFNIANIAFLTWTWLHEPWKQLPEKCTVYKRDILNVQRNKAICTWPWRMWQGKALVSSVCFALLWLGIYVGKKWMTCE